MVQSKDEFSTFTERVLRPLDIMNTIIDSIKSPFQKIGKETWKVMRVTSSTFNPYISPEKFVGHLEFRHE